MRVIIIEDTVYKVTEKEYKQLKYMEDKINNSSYPDNQHYEMALDNYLQENKSSYTKIGAVSFDFRL